MSKIKYDDTISYVIDNLQEWPVLHRSERIGVLNSSIQELLDLKNKMLKRNKMRIKNLPVPPKEGV